MVCFEKECRFQQPWEHHVPCRRKKGHPGVHEWGAAKARIMDIDIEGPPVVNSCLTCKFNQMDGDCSILMAENDVTDWNDVNDWCQRHIFSASPDCLPLDPATSCPGWRESQKSEPRCFFVTDTREGLLTEEKAIQAAQECAEAIPSKNFYVCKIVSTTSVHKVVVVKPFE